VRADSGAGVRSRHPQLEPLRRLDPDRVGPYLLLSRLGAGSMGRVYLGQSASGRLVAVKTIRVEYAEEADFRARFAHEVAAARRVSGVFTAAVVAADPDAAVPWLATAYVPAPSLARLVAATGPLPVPAVRWLAAGCAEALDSIHTAGLVHRDLKPSNVLVSQDGPRVIDFGVARAVERVQLTTARGSLGTPAYMAPEQARDTRRASAASDVFSLGSTLAYAATGHPPYRGETVTDILVRLATQPPDLTDLPADLVEVVTGCLAPEPADRPTPAALLATLAPDVHLDADGPPSLADSALELMAEYLRRPRAPERISEEPDRTIGSQPGIAGSMGSMGSSVSWSVPVDRWAAETRGAGAPGDTPGAGTPGAAGPAGGTPAGDAAGGAGPAGARPAGGAPAGEARVAGGPGGGGPGGGGPAGEAPVADGLAGEAPAGEARVAGGPGGAPPGTRPGAAVAAWRHGLVPALLAVALLVSGGVVGGLVGGWLARGDPPRAQESTDGGRPPDGAPPGPPSGERAQAGGPPKVYVSQPRGDGATIFVVYGRGWRPGQVVTVALAGGRTSPYRLFVDRAGTFNYAVNQAHEFFSDELPPGHYTVMVRGSDGQTGEATFEVGRR